MSKPRYRWWGYARKMVRDYPKLNSSLHLTVDDQREREAVTNAIKITEAYRNGSERIALIRCAYWGRSQVLLRDAALQIHISQRTAERWHSDFIRLVGKCRGFNVDDYFCAQDETGGQNKASLENANKRGFELPPQEGPLRGSF